jgi:DNA-binding response OmpR family regulator
MDRPTILIADDEEYIVEILASLLEEEGFGTLRAFDGEEALTLARRNAPALVITDAMMPKVSGIELIKRLKEEDKTRDVPVILMSCVLQEPGNTGAAYFFPKPFDLDTVIRVVKEYTGQSPVGGRATV